MRIIDRHTGKGGAGHHIVPAVRPVPAEIAKNAEFSETTFTRDWWQGGVIEFIKRAADRANSFVKSVRGIGQQLAFDA